MDKAAKLATLARFVLRPGQWDAKADAWANLLPCDSPGNLVARLAAMVRAGDAKVCDMVRDGARVGFVVFTPTPDHELLVHAAFGRDPAPVTEPGPVTPGPSHVPNLMGEFMPSLESLARACECRSIRFHTMRAGMVQRGQEHGFRVSEIIMRKDVP